MPELERVDSIRGLEHEFKPFVEAAVLPHLHHFSKLKCGAVISTNEEDTRVSFDMRVGLWVPVSVRLRGANFFRQYRDFSIRSKTRYSGKTLNGEVVKCELDKLKDGLGNCYFYGWLSDDESVIEHYMIVDMNRFRAHLDEGRDRKNPDGYTCGRYYSRALLFDTGSMVYQSWDDSDHPISKTYGLII